MQELQEAVRPEAVWQAAAQRSHAPTHPMCSSPSVRAWLQRQRRLHASLISGTYQERHGDFRGVVSPDCAKIATLEADCSLRVRDLLSGGTLHCCPLPPGLVYNSDESYSFDPSSTVVAIPYGDAAPYTSGFVFVDFGTGSSVEAPLPGPGLAVVFITCSAGLWSSEGTLLEGTLGAVTSPFML